MGRDDPRDLREILKALIQVDGRKWSEKNTHHMLVIFLELAQRKGCDKEKVTTLAAEFLQAFELTHLVAALQERFITKVDLPEYVEIIFFEFNEW